MPKKTFREVVQSIQVVHRKCNFFRNAKIVIWAKTEKGKKVWVRSLYGLDEVLIETKVKIAQELFEKLVGSDINFVKDNDCYFVVKGSLPKQFMIYYKDLKEKKQCTVKKEAARYRQEKKAQIPIPTIAPQESRCGSMPGFLNVGQNILDQDPFCEILLSALKKSLDWRDYWKGEAMEVQERFKPRDQRHNSWEYGRRYTTRMTLQCFLVNAATKRIRYEGIMSFQVSPLKAGLPEDARGSTRSCEYTLFEALMASAAQYPGWDTYLREYRQYVTACGEPRSMKRKIPTFASWATSQKSEVAVG